MTDEREAPCARHCEATAFEIEIRHLKHEIESLRQQLASAKAALFQIQEAAKDLLQQLAECQADNKRLRDALKSAGHYAVYGDKFHAREVIEQALALPSDSTALDTILAECQAREKVLRDALKESYDEDELCVDPDDFVKQHDSTALDTMLKQAKREALLEAAEIADDMDWSDGVIGRHFRNMAKELE